MEKGARVKRTKKMEGKEEGIGWRRKAKGKGMRKHWVKVRERNREEKNGKRKHGDGVLAGGKRKNKQIEQGRRQKRRE